MRVLLTGMSGTGVSTVLARLRRLGHATVDLDDEGYLLESRHASRWDEPKVRRLLDTGPDPLFVGGCAENQVLFYPDFDRVVLLSAPPDVVRERVLTRTTNPFGKRPGELDRILTDRTEVEPLLRRGASLEVDTSAVPVDEVVRRVLEHAGLAGGEGLAGDGGAR